MRCEFGSKRSASFTVNEVASPFLRTMRSRSFATAVHIALWFVLYLALTHLGGKTPEFRVGDSASPLAPGPVPVASMASLFSPAQWLSPHGLTNLASPFLTTHFV